MMHLSHRSYRTMDKFSPDSLFIFIAICCVLLANISLAFQFHGLIHDDAVLYRIHDFTDMASWKGKVHSLVPLRQAVSLGLMRHVSPALARVFIIVAYIPVTILLTYTLLRRYWSINRVSSVVASTLPFLIAFQTQLPLGINISYHIVDLLVALAALHIVLYIVSAQHARPIFLPLFLLLFIVLSEGMASAVIFIPVLLLLALFHPGPNGKPRLATVVVLFLACVSVVTGELALARRSASMANLTNLTTVLKLGWNAINPFYYGGTVLRVGYNVLFWTSFCAGVYHCLARCVTRDWKLFSMLLWSTAIPICPLRCIH